MNEPTLEEQRRFRREDRRWERQKRRYNHKRTIWDDIRAALIGFLLGGSIIVIALLLLG